ncbi:MAG: hypothetical protein IT438_09605 [Phycisphaerales bacterium]|nr:hypothetical protein [Phycisphaerales bacterium]
MTPVPAPDLTAAHALLQGLIDYAGLFPPAKLGMAESARNYAAYLRSPESWMLGRFICPVSRLEEFRAATVGLLPTPSGNGAPGTPHSDSPWPISAVIDGDLDENLDAIFAFNAEHAIPARGLAVIDAAEIKIPPEKPAAAFIDESLDLMSEEVYPFFELPPGGDLRGPIAALSGADAGAKLRTGGITPDAFPPAPTVAGFLLACAAADVPFKATAGLHHPIRSEHPLTYEPGCPRGTMHGFVNVFFAAALAHAHRHERGGEQTLARILSETDPRAFRFEPGSITWNEHALDISQLGIARETFALSFGSCSFTEPVQDLRALGVV